MPRLNLEPLEDRNLLTALLALADSGNSLLRFDSATPTVTTPIAVTGIAPTDTLRGIDFRPLSRVLYGLGIDNATHTQARLYTIDLSTGAATALPQVTVGLIAGNDWGMSFDTNTSAIRIVNNNRENTRIDPVTGGLVSHDTPLSAPGSVNIDSLANAPAFTPGSPYGINRATNSLARIAGPSLTNHPENGFVFDLGSLGVSVDLSPTGLDGDVNGTLFAAMTPNGGLTSLFTIQRTTGHATLLGVIGTGTTTIASVAVLDPHPLLVVGADAGAGPQVKAYDRLGNQLLFSFNAFDAGFGGGVRVAAGDVTGDVADDIVVGAGPGADPAVKVYDGVTGALVHSFLAFDGGFKGGVTVAAADVNGDGFADVIVGAGAGAGPHVKVFSGKDLSLLASFYAFDAGFSGGVTVAGGDVDGDHHADIVVGAGPGAGPHVRVFSGNGLAVLRSFYAFAADFHGGVNVAAGDFNGDGFADLYAGAGPGGGSHVIIFNGVSVAPIRDFFAYNPNTQSPDFPGGVRVAALDVALRGRSDIVTAAGPGSPPEVLTLLSPGLDFHGDFLAFDAGFLGGVFVG
jgi:hypothetical protein